MILQLVLPFPLPTRTTMEEAIDLLSKLLVRGGDVKVTGPFGFASSGKATLGQAILERSKGGPESNLKGAILQVRSALQVAGRL